jgi:hypothetical protein
VGEVKSENCLLQVATINCHFRLPNSFDNLHTLFEHRSKEASGSPVDIYCVNLQQIVYRGKRTFFNGDAEQAPGRAWLAAIPE